MNDRHCRNDITQHSYFRVKDGRRGFGRRFLSLNTLSLPTSFDVTALPLAHIIIIIIIIAMAPCTSTPTTAVCLYRSDRDRREVGGHGLF